MDVNLTVPLTPLSLEATATLLAMDDAFGPGGDVHAHWSEGGWMVHRGAVPRGATLDSQEFFEMKGNMLPQDDEATARMRFVVREVFLVRTQMDPPETFIVSCVRLKPAQDLRLLVVTCGAILGLVIQALFAGASFLLTGRMLPAYALFAAALVGAFVGLLVTFVVQRFLRGMPRTEGLDDLVNEVRAKATPFLVDE